MQSLVTREYFSFLDPYIIEKGRREDDFRELSATYNPRYYITYELPPEFKIDRELLEQQYRAGTIRGYDIEKPSMRNLNQQITIYY